MDGLLELQLDPLLVLECLEEALLMVEPNARLLEDASNLDCCCERRFKLLDKMAGMVLCRDCFMNRFKREMGRHRNQDMRMSHREKVGVKTMTTDADSQEKS
ncbi:expressed unknown protein [Seminavis robusta]|uniref:Uncharacterized protein n=1 Tax=Seminavis robusta TaxID=568900 RepID=A0A9N8ERX3_9STRA|nr:expressed unknown protein [Seminavis robusta]|eukprot:Sro1925_g305770.1 n/a (102) ;mRNA; r:3384-4038